MKNLLLLSLIVILFSCKKELIIPETAAVPVQSERDTIVRRSTPPPVPNPFDNESSRVILRGNYTLAYAFPVDTCSGFTANVLAKKVGTEKGRSFWGSGTTDSLTWVQCGYKEDGKPVIEYYGGPGISNIEIVGQSPIVMNSEQSFYIKSIGGGRWEVGRNGVPILRFYEGGSKLHNIQTGIEYYGSNQNFPELNCNPAIQVLHGETWSVPPAAYVTYCGRWGLSGNLQNPSLKRGQILFAGKNKPLSINSWIYQ